jgi:hypothetical protein
MGELVNFFRECTTNDLPGDCNIAPFFAITDKEVVIANGVKQSCYLLVNDNFAWLIANCYLPQFP